MVLPVALLAVMQVGARAQTPPSKQLLSEEGLRRVFVTECMGPRPDTQTMSFCSCAFTRLLSRYGLDSFAKQDAILRSSNATNLAQLTRLAWEPELTSCRSK